MAIYTPAMNDLYGMDPMRSAMLTMLASPVFLISAPLCHLLIKKNIMSRRTLIYFSMSTLSVIYFVATGQLFGGKPHFWVTCLSTSLSGGFLAFVFVVCFPEMVEAAED